MQSQQQERPRSPQKKRGRPSNYALSERSVQDASTTLNRGKLKRPKVTSGEENGDNSDATDDVVQRKPMRRRRRSTGEDELQAPAREGRQVSEQAEIEAANILRSRDGAFASQKDQANASKRRRRLTAQNVVEVTTNEEVSEHHSTPNQPSRPSRERTQQPEDEDEPVTAPESLRQRMKLKRGRITATEPAIRNEKVSKSRKRRSDAELLAADEAMYVQAFGQERGRTRTRRSDISIQKGDTSISLREHSLERGRKRTRQSDGEAIALETIAPAKLTGKHYESTRRSKVGIEELPARTADKQRRDEQTRPSDVQQEGSHNVKSSTREHVRHETQDSQREGIFEIEAASSRLARDRRSKKQVKPARKSNSKAHASAPSQAQVKNSTRVPQVVASKRQKQGETSMCLVTSRHDNQS